MKDEDGRMKKGSAPSTLHPSSIVHHPSKRLGQNILTDQRVIQRIVEALAPKPDETIVEIGPGRGALTHALLDNAGRLVAIEFDRNLIPILEESFGSKENFTLVQDDALITDVCG